VTSPLNAVPAGSNILVDANIFIHGLSAKSAQCKAFLGRCSKEEVTGVALFETVNDATYQFMKGEAVQKGFCSGQAMKYLAEHPDVVGKLADYWVNAERLLALNLLFVPVDEEIVRSAQAERVSAGLMTNDSIMVAAMRKYGIPRIATHDRQFEGVAGLTVFSPSDIP